MDKRYNVIFSNLIKERDYFRRHMLRLGVSGDVSDEIIKKAPVILKRNLSLRDARQYADAVIEAGGRVTVHIENHSDGSGKDDPGSGLVGMKDFVMCPRCGHKQVRSEACIRCKYVL